MNSTNMDKDNIMTACPKEDGDRRIIPAEGSSTSCEPEPSIVQSSASTTTETNVFKCVRAGVMVVWMLSVVIVAKMVHVLTSEGEQRGFETEFQNSAHQVTLMATTNAVNMVLSIKTMASIFPTAAAFSNTTFPFITLDGFEDIAFPVRNVSKASRIVYAPLLRTTEELQYWRTYSDRNSQWIVDGLAYQNRSSNEFFDTFVSYAYRLNETSFPLPVDTAPAFPLWQTSPVPSVGSFVNFDALTDPIAAVGIKHAMTTGTSILSAPMDSVEHGDLFDVVGPVSMFIQPVFNRAAYNVVKNVTGVLMAYFGWKNFFDNILPIGQHGLELVVNSCDVIMTFRVDGPVTKFVGYDDLHNPKFTYMKITTPLFVDHDANHETAKEQCRHLLSVYPTQDLMDALTTRKPLQYTAIVVSIFVVVTIIFMSYDRFVTNRQNRAELRADKSNAIVQELFPGDTANQLFGRPSQDVIANNELNALCELGKVNRTTIAELYPETTVLFADISGFTAWSSIRDPHQVFTLLESIFQEFDAIAKMYGVYKVETVGDCYVAACGLPKENARHAVVMCRFARLALIRFQSVCHGLELTLGPDTGDLALRIGMHSGPVTAGVLRGDRARFQLFGDTVNTASRIESTGLPERVHLSEQTAIQLVKHGKGDWIVCRDDAVEAKGKGKLVTYWLKLSHLNNSPGSVTGSSVMGDGERAADTLQSSDFDVNEWNVELPGPKADASDRLDRFVQWSCDLLLELLQRVVSRRCAVSAVNHVPDADLSDLAQSIGDGTTVADEVAEIIDMPEFVCASKYSEVKLGDDVVNQLREYIGEVAIMYNDNSFHNFEHAAHVTMSIHKLLTRIVAPKIDGNACSDAEQQEARLHDHTYGITSDPLTQFAVVLSGLIHDLDHQGVSNGQLIKEDPKLALMYKEKCVAEQNSVDLAWDLLMSHDYDQLRKAIFTTKAELHRFRSLLVNSVIATDIFDKDQSTLRMNRWNKAFFETPPDDTSHVARSRKATIVIEHLIQASDVAHTMQHWQVYQKWNHRLFIEMITAYRAGRSEKDPSVGWYAGELWFFDNYVIPLAQKLKECGVFGVSSDEYLNYAVQNRAEWESKGKYIVQKYVEEFEMSAVDR